MLDICSFVGIAKVGIGRGETGLGDVTCGVAIVGAKSRAVPDSARWRSRVGLGAEAARFV